MEVRRRELGMSDKPDRTRNTICLPEMRTARMGLCVATQIARYSGRFSKLPGWASPEQAWAATQGQLAWYRCMEDCGEMVQLRTAYTITYASTADAMGHRRIRVRANREGAAVRLSPVVAATP